MEVPLRTAYGQNGRCSMQPKPSSLRAQAQLKHELKLELVEEKQKLLDIRERRENARVPLKHGGTLNNHRAASPLVWLVEGDERWEAPGHPQGFLPLNWGGTEQNCTVTCMVLKAKANDRRKNSCP
ncbi:uncharacterized protein TNCV_307961 [Trichonephila clavipes]|nr:uncharacterized protein TNCV_307961 [Trichonephila clavipes]